MRGFFITGTDTGVGKTIVSSALLEAARARGLRAVGMKPIETGCTWQGDALIPSDGCVLQCASSIAADLDDVCPCRLEQPAAPSVAARSAGVTIDLAVIDRAHARLLHTGPDLIVVEGAGGLLVPIDSEHTIADLARRFGYPLVIVAPNRLGTINHTLSTIDVARHRGLLVAGVVLNNLLDDPTAETNADEIERFGQTRILGCLPQLSPQTDLASVAERVLQLETLLV